MDKIQPKTREELEAAGWDVQTSYVEDLEERDVTFTENGTLDIVPSEGKKGLSRVGVTVNVEHPLPALQDKEVEYTSNGVRTVVADHGYDGLSSVEVRVNTPTPADPTEPVLFFDYDGTLLYSYTIAEAQTLTELPAVPTHDGLTGQGWTHTLAEVNGVVGALHVGAQYRTTNGRTKFRYTLTPITGLAPTIYVSGTGSFTVYWPDGTSASYTGAQTITKTHADYGDFEAEIEVTNGTITLGLGTITTAFFGGDSTNYKQALTSIFIGEATRIGGYTFYACSSLASIVISYGATSIGDRAFQNCYSLASIVIPDGVTSIGAYAFYACYSLVSIVIPDGVTSIEDNAFQNCYSFISIVIPVSVRSIGTYTFRNCYAIREYVVESETPPTLGNSAFTGIVPICKIYVPDASVEAYKTAPNWVTYADYIYPISQRL